jgi:hypothetical protein
VKDANEIKNKIINEGSPILSSNLAKSVGSIFSGVMSSVVPSSVFEKAGSEFFKWVTSIDADFIIFDDFERSAMPADEVMVFISTLIVPESTKIIIIGNEKEIKK